MRSQEIVGWKWPDPKWTDLLLKTLRKEVLARERDGDGLGAGTVELKANERLTAQLPATPGLAGPILGMLNASGVADANRIQDTEFIDNNTNLTELFGALDYRLVPRVGLHAERRRIRRT